jgi:hypothetical protein
MRCDARKSSAPTSKASQLEPELAQLVEDGEVPPQKTRLERSVSQNGAVGALVFDLKDNRVVSTNGLPPALDR